MKNKVIVWAIIYSILSIAFKLYVFYSGNQNSRLGDLSHLLTLLLIFPFIAIAIFISRKNNGGLISGRDAVRQGMLFTFIVIIVLGVFNYIFYEVELGKFIAATYLNVDYNELLIEAKKHDKTATLEKVMANQKTYVASFTAFKDTTFKIFGYLLFGGFSSFVGAVILKKG